MWVFSCNPLLYLEPPTNQVSTATNYPTSNNLLLLDQMDGVGYMNMAYCKHTCKGTHLSTSITWS